MQNAAVSEYDFSLRMQVSTKVLKFLMSYGHPCFILLSNQPGRSKISLPSEVLNLGEFLVSIIRSSFCFD